MALYRLVANADELKDLVADSAAASIRPEIGNEPLITVLHEWALQAHSRLVTLPGLTTYVIHRWTELPGWLSIVESFLALAERDTLEGETAVHTVNAVFSYVLARVQLRESITPRRRLGPVVACPDRYEHINASRRHFGVACSDVAFRFGLDALTLGLSELVGGSRRQGGHLESVAEGGCP